MYDIQTRLTMAVAYLRSSETPLLKEMGEKLTKRLAEPMTDQDAKELAATLEMFLSTIASH